MKTILAVNKAQQLYFEGILTLNNDNTTDLLSINSTLFVNESSQLANTTDADLYIDCIFSGSFYSPIDKPLLINETTETFAELLVEHKSVARFCGWPTFLQNNSWVLSTNNLGVNWANLLLNLNKQTIIVEDIAGLISAGIVANIINEAYYTFNMQVSTKAEIDMAMKLGTNYPYGPFEWAELIGKENIIRLLNKIGADNFLIENKKDA